MVGGGIYVLTGTVARKVAGPGVVLSYLFSGLAAMLSAICYAEFGARLPKTGSAYTFTYVTVGEIWAFIIGWNIILEHALGAASVARAWSGSLDAMVGGAITNGTMETIGRMDVPMLGHYPDFVAVAALFGVIIVVAIGVKVSSVVNSVLTVFNIICVLIIIFVGFFYIQPDNWNNPDHGGFLPFGFFGVFGGAATCFYAYVGFESIVLAGEETQNPEKSIPIATMVSLTTATVLYIFSSAVLTLMIPYFEVDLAAPFPNAFGYYGLTVVKYIVAVGSILGTSTSLLGSMFALPRSVYAMAVDRLFFGVFDRVSERTQTPLLAIVVFGALSALLGLLLDIDQLVQFLSVGTLLSYTMVAVSLLVLRYEPADRCHFQLKPEQAGHVASSSSRETLTSGGDAEDGGEGDQKHLIRTSQSHDNIGRLRTPFSSIPFLSNTEPGRVSHGAIVCLIIFISAFSLTLSYGYEQLGDGVWWVVCLLILSILGIGLSFTVLLLHEHNKSFTTFQVHITIAFILSDCYNVF